MERMTDWNELLNKGYDAIICEEEPKYYVALNPEKQVKILEVHDMNEDVTSLDRFKYEKNISVFIYDLLNLGKQVNPSNPYDWVADKMEEMSKWNKKDWEYLFKKELSFQDIRGAQTTFEKINQEIKKLADSYEESKRFGKLQENLEELKDGIYATQSAYDILNLFKNKPKAYRVVYDKNNRYYFIGDALKYIHSDLISAAYNQGFYYDDIQSNSRHDIMMYLGNALEFVEVLMLSFFPKDFGDIKALDNERSSDWYNHKYVYDFGTIYTQEHCPLEEFDFYRLLGEPLEQEELELPESLNEEDYTYINSEGKNVEILILNIDDNPNRLRDFAKEHYALRSFIFDDKMYFWDCETLHETIASKLDIAYDIENRFIIDGNVIDGCYIKALKDLCYDYGLEEAMEIAQNYKRYCKKLAKFGLYLKEEDEKLLEDICNGNIEIDDEIYETLNGTKQFHKLNKLFEKYLNEEEYKYIDNTKILKLSPNADLNEKFEELESGIYATQSAYDLINWMKNKPKAYRVVYDENIRYYFIADAYSYIHQDILESAYRSGFYPEMFSEDEIRDYIDDGMNLDMNNKKPFLLFFAFSLNSDKNLDLEKSSDGYTRKYTYDFGSIYAHELTPLEDFDLYQLLKEPISKETIYENIYTKLCEDISKFL